GGKDPRQHQAHQDPRKKDGGHKGPRQLRVEAARTAGKAPRGQPHPGGHGAPAEQPQAAREPPPPPLAAIRHGPQCDHEAEPAGPKITPPATPATNRSPGNRSRNPSMAAISATSAE